MAAILTPVQIDVAWLNERLKDAGHDVVLASFTQTDVGTGQVGRCIRYDLSYVGDPGAAPLSLVAKFSSDNATSKDTGQAMKTYRTEVDFYRTIAPAVSIRVPICYYADIDEHDREHILLMQDMAPAEQGDQIAGCSVEVARQAVTELVGLQAPSWRKTEYYDLLGRVEDGPFADMKGLYNSTMPGFVERYAAQMDPEHIQFIQAIGAAERCPMFEFHGEHFALEHYDFRLDNVMVGQVGQDVQVTTVDWQSVRVGKPLNDVAYFIGSGLPTGLRREAEMEILRGYHDALLLAGVEDFTWQDCLREYRKGIFAGFAVSVVAPVLVERTARGDEMFTAMASRYAQMAIDLGADEFFS